MDVKDFLRALRRSWWLVLIAVLLAAAGAAGLTAATPRQYASSVTFFVGTSSNGVTDAYQGGLFSQQRVKSYAALLTGDRLAAAVAQDRTIGLTAAQVQSRVSARAVPDTVLLQATATDLRPERAQRLAATLADRFVAMVTNLETPSGGRTPTVNVQVVAGPLLNPVPVAPRPERNLALAILLGLLLGAGAAVLREVLDTSVKTVDALNEVTGAAVLAVVPFDAGTRQHPLVTGENAHSARAESFRQLRTNLQFVDVDRPVTVVAITSAVPEEGKSTTAVNLAIAFAEAGHRVLLVEADLRRPRIAEYLGLEGAAGLSNVLAGQVTVDDVVQRWGLDQLYVLPCGVIPPNPSELLGSAAMSGLIDRERRRFDIIIFDTPPLLPVTDGAVVAVKADGAVVVTRSGRTSRTDVSRALGALSTVDARVLGCVLNMQPGRNDTPYRYRYQDHRARPAARRFDEAPIRPASARAGAPVPPSAPLGAGDAIRSPR